MKAIVYTEYGPPETLKLQEVAKPAPKENEILVRNHAASVTYGDLAARNFKAISAREFNMPGLFWLLAKISFGLNKPKLSVLGSEFAGEVEAVGQAVTAFKPGDAVFGYLGPTMGAYAEYVCLPENGVVVSKPANISYEEAAVIPYGAIMALALLRKADLQPGQKVLILGASGSIGAAAMQIAKHLGAEVTGVGGTPRLEFMRALGADKVVDYTVEDFSQNGERYDLIFDVLGRGSFNRFKQSLKPDGRYLLASFKSKQLRQMVWSSLTGGPKVICAIAPGSVADLRAVKELIEAGALKAIIDQRFPLAQTAAAHRYVEEGRKQGHIVITI
jgi:NADPH:quinone reductase-like Zn-dependent oxidoreductase